MGTFLRDVRYAARGLVRSPGFTVLAVTCLALGIGVNSTVFSIADSVSFAPLPFHEAGRLAVLESSQPAVSAELGNVSYPDFRDWQRELRSLPELAAYGYRSLSITEGIESERFEGAAVTWNLFPMLGVSPVLGRQFLEDDDRVGAAPVVMLSDGVWRRRFNGDRLVIGRTVIVDGAAHTVVGVMPPRFAFPQVGQLWVPLVPRYHATPRAERTLIPVGRLAADASVRSATAELADIAARLAREHRENDGWTAAARPLRDELMPGNLRIAATAMLGAVSLVLLIACTNVANLLLARATGRQREMAVRLSLGATRGRLLRQLLTESAMLGLLGTPLGLAIAYAGLTYMMAAVPATVIVPYYVDWTVNQRVIVYTVLAALATALVFGLAPAYQAGRANVVAALKDGSRGAGTGRSRNRLRNTLVVAEVALSAVLLVAASLFVRSAVNINRADVGIETAQLMTLRVSMAGDRYATPLGISAQMHDVVRRIEVLSGVASAAVSNLTPFAGGASTGGVVADGAAVEAGHEPQAIHFGTTAHGLRTLGQTLVAGRDFTDTEASTLSGTAIVNQALAQRLWPTLPDVIGRRFRFAANPEQPFTVVGVVSDFQPLAVRDKDRVQPVAILPLPHRAVRDLGVTIRVAGIAPASITAAARDAIGQSDSSLALFNVRTADEHRRGRIWASQLLSWMFSIFGVVALLLAAIGIYGVLSYSIAQRTQEIGVRMALGATRGNIVTLVVGQAARLAAVGISIGAVGAFAITRFVQSILYNVTPGDAIGYAGTALLLIAAVALAGCYPALRATRVDPIEALRAD